MTSSSRSCPVVWLATGLNPVVTGIETFLLQLLDELLREKVLEPSSMEIYTDEDAAWRDELKHREVAVRTHPTNLRGGTRVVHNFGRSTSKVASEFMIYSTYDWGPFRDREMTLKSRVAWSTAISLGHMRADCVHYINSVLPSERPLLVRKARRSIIADPVIPRNDQPLPLLTTPSHGLFVGTAVARKRLDLLGQLAPKSPLPILMAGTGTEGYSTGGNLTGLGRVSDDELGKLYAGAGFLILISDYEGYGIPIAEAAQVGLRSVVSRPVYENLDQTLKAFCHPCDPHVSSSFRSACNVALSRRGTGILVRDAPYPLTELYRSLLKA